MTPEAMGLLSDMRRAGLCLEARPSGTIHVRPLELLTPEYRQAIVSNKPAILAALDLEQRLQAMAKRWSYAPDELAETLASARANFDGWLSIVEDDERHAALFERAGSKYPA